MSQLLVYKASAGSGKTFTLAVEYIKLLVLDPRSYKRILAVTFTNKATAEMKERILGQLYGIATEDKDSTAYLERIAAETGMSHEAIRHAANEALGYILHDYHRFRVETIDSFFQSVMRNLARELELSPNLNIVLDNDEVLDEAVDTMIEELTPETPVLAWLLDYIDERISNDKRWNVADEVKQFGRNIFNELYIEKGDGLREKLKHPGVVTQYRKQLRALAEEVLNDMKAYATRFEEILAAHALSAGELKNGARGIASYFRKLQMGVLGSEIRNATVEKSMEDAENWATKTSPRRNDIISLASSTLMPLLCEAEQSRMRDNRLLNSCRLSLRHLSKVQLLAQIDEEVRTLNHNANRFLLSDTNALLHRLVEKDDASFVFEKTGIQLRHVMIDEFQDTSRMQWGNFKLLLLEGLSQGADSLIVGDVKQSIYRWRNGDWGILNNLNERLGQFPVQVRTLTTNRRSEENIIDFNNHLFTQAVEWLNGLYRAQLGHDCEDLLQAYADVQQDSPRHDHKGYVKVSFLAPDDEGDYVTHTLKSLGDEVKRLLASGISQDDIAILVRKNKNIPIIADYFDQELHYKIVSDEAFRLDSSLAVNIMLDALRYLSDETNGVACAQLAIAYRCKVLQESVSLNDILLHPSMESFLPEEFRNRKSALRLMPLHELLEELFRIFSLERIPSQDAYLFAFFDGVTEFLKNHPSGMEGFISYWDETLCTKNIPGGEVEGIRIYSIHKSKGLEFHTVLIPFCDWRLENETNDQLVWCAPQYSPFNELDILPVNYSSAMAESIYADDYLRERLQLWVDNLNLLYVAFTRAGKNLIVWSCKEQRNTVSELLANALPAVASAVGAMWDDAIYEQGELCLSSREDARVVTNKLLQKPQKHSVHMEAMSHPVEFRQSNRSADFIQGIDEEESDDRFINRGRLLHTLFSGIETVDDIEPAIERLVHEGIIRNAEKEEMLREIAIKAFSLPQVQDWYSGKWKLFSECSILYKQDGMLQIRRPDRVMMKDGEVIVVDFKFGKERSHYRKQVHEYMQLLAQMGHKHITGYLWYVDEERIVPVS